MKAEQIGFLPLIAGGKQISQQVFHLFKFVFSQKDHA
ncbi:hypothetical protein SAMN06265368_3164 [Cohaesibacter gelatinilyticus]|uniref:Uncharacterized protein n=1 Tax=Cohaesibacter gelatinilyticus TaxID=372072 RepID=A0A285PEA7_9HYPH|nr:hypothetical protein SAMN06265368_3164 [Cohaesibacter gelatinilyticus]